MLKAPATGDYRFFIAADDAGMLWISADATRSRRKVAAFCEGWTEPNQWDRYDTQKSKPIHLEQGKRYAIEMAWRNNGSLGHASVGWQPPGADAPAVLPVVTLEGTLLLEPAVASPDDTDDDALPDEWERAHGLKVVAGNGTQGGFGDADNDGLTNQEEYMLDTDPNKEQGAPGHAMFETWNNLSAVVISLTYPEEVPCLMPAEPSRALAPIDRLVPPGGYSAAWVRCVLKVPHDGYYRLSVEANGRQVMLLSDDATPGRLNQSWRDGALWNVVGPGFKEPRLRLDSHWIHFKRNEPRYFEIRHLHSDGPSFINLAWTDAKDGVRTAIPADCIASYLPSDDEKSRKLATGVLPDQDGGCSGLTTVGDPQAIRLDLRSARALTTGWSEFGEGCGGWLEGKTTNNRSLPKKALATTFGGSLEIPFKVSTTGYHVLAMEAQLCFSSAGCSHFVITREIDGIRFGREILATKSTDGGTFRLLTPWLTKGNHTLRLHLAPDTLVGTFRLLGLEARALEGEKTKAEAKSRLAAMNGFLPDRGDGPSKISPVCVEVASRTSSPPKLRAGGRTVAVREATPGTWWADVPLPESGAPVKLVCSSDADLTEVSTAARWAETRVHEAKETVLRTGDSLRLTAWRDGGGKGARAALTVQGRTISTPDGKPAAVRFDKAGIETITAVFTPASGEPLRSEMVVHVLPRLERTIETEWTRTDRVSDFKPLPDGAWPDGGIAAAFRLDPEGKWQTAPKLAGNWPAVVRAGAAGPVMGSIEVHGIEISYEIRNHSVDNQSIARNLSDKACYYGIARNLPPGWRIAFDHVPNDNRPWNFLRPDKTRPFHQETYPYRYGVCAIGEFWFIRTGAPDHWINGDLDVIPPDGGK